jgi:methionine-rich copper-binding protein CopC
LPAGGYTVAWRGIGDDGHVVRGDFTFSVTAQ